MYEYLIFGITFSFAAAVQPGPLQAFLFAKVNEIGWKKTLPASFSPLISDGPIALLVLLVIKNLPSLWGDFLRIAGGLFLLYLAYFTYKSLSKKKEEKDNSNNSTPKTVFQAVVVNILNPNPYIGWSLILGPEFLKAWKSGPADGVLLLGSFYGTMIIFLGLTIIAFGTTKFLGEKLQKKLIFVSSILLAVLGIFQLYSGIISI